jgi:GNAT superfamily N-acetyltransferase
MSEEIRIRTAAPTDAALVLDFIRELATYERLAHQVVASEETVRETLFGARPAAESLIAELGGAPAGFAIFFHNYSTFLSRPGLYLEDLFVKPAFRRRGVGGALFRQVARLAVERRCGRFEWSVLDWNQPAIAFYRSLGAEPLTDWTVFRLTGEALSRVGSRER